MADGVRHDWDLTPSQAIELQKKLAKSVRIEPLRGIPRTIAGVDCALVGGGFRGRGASEIVAAAVLCDAETMELVEMAWCRRRLDLPYVPGLLSFREAPAVIEAVEKLSVRPDLLMCDGQGLAHPRGLGLASHVGLWLDVPTTGVAKSRLCGEHGEVGGERGASAPLMYEGEVVGTVVRTRANVRPLYVSVGHRITLDEAVQWVLAAGRGVRLPQPTRLADQLAGRIKAGGGIGGGADSE